MLKRYIFPIILSLILVINVCDAIGEKNKNQVIYENVTTKTSAQYEDDTDLTELVDVLVGIKDKAGINTEEPEPIVKRLALMSLYTLVSGEKAVKGVLSIGDDVTKATSIACDYVADSINKGIPYEETREKMFEFINQAYQHELNKNGLTEEDMEEDITSIIVSIDKGILYAD